MKQNINHIIIALALLLAGNISTHAATGYGIYVAGKEITSDNCNNFTDSQVEYNEYNKDYFVRYDPSTKTLTIHNVKIDGSGSNFRGIYNKSCDGLTIVFEGRNYFRINAACIRLEKNTTMKGTTGSLGYDSRIRLVLYNGHQGIYLCNGAQLTVEDLGVNILANVINTGDGIEGQKGTETVTLNNACLESRLYMRYPLKNIDYLTVNNSFCYLVGDSKAAYNLGGVMVTGGSTYITPNTSYNYSKKTFITDGTEAESVKIDYCKDINGYNFVDENFRNIVANYDTDFDGKLSREEASAVTEINVEGKGIRTMTGIENFFKLNKLNCQDNLINDFYMTDLIDRLPNTTGGYLVALTPGPYPEGNICREKHVEQAAAKGWMITYSSANESYKYNGHKSYGVVINGTELNVDNFEDIMSLSGVSSGPDGAAYFNPATCKLFLSDVTLNSQDNYLCLVFNKASYKDYNLTIELGEKPVYANSVSGKALCGGSPDGNIIVKGDGEIHFKSSNSSCIEAYLTVEGNATVFAETEKSNYRAFYKGSLTVRENGAVRAISPGVVFKNMDGFTLEDNATFITPHGATWDEENKQLLDADGNEVKNQEVWIGTIKQIPRIYIDDFTWPQHNRLGDYEVSTQTEGVKSVEVQYRKQNFDRTVIDPTHVFEAGEWPEIDFIIYPELGYEFISNGMQGTRVVVPTADNLTNNTYRNYSSSDGARRYFFDDYMVPTPDNSIATGIDSATNDQLQATGGTWYTLDGQQLNTKPTQKGIYLFKGKKVVVR